jgi:hypothetical protein
MSSSMDTPVIMSVRAALKTRRLVAQSVEDPAALGSVQSVQVVPPQTCAEPPSANSSLPFT